MPGLISYVGRTVDVSAFQNISTESKTLLTQAIASPGQGGLAITGIAKLGQRFLLELLTEIGSMPFLPSRGSSFMIEARMGLIRTQQDLIAAFTRALIDVEKSLTGEDSDSNRLDEQYGSATIEEIELNRFGAKISVRLTSQDPAAKAIIPVSLVL